MVIRPHGDGTAFIGDAAGPLPGSPPPPGELKSEVERLRKKAKDLKEPDGPGRDAPSKDLAGLGERLHREAKRAKPPRRGLTRGTARGTRTERAVTAGAGGWLALTCPPV